ncbi:MAG TPA: tetratricopeptide repeat protein [Verrucomicrobiota bacterium]|nr:tetratricopeptide repeat protein [Verrucomicrobiota bacterium]
MAASSMLVAGCGSVPTRQPGRPDGQAQDVSEREQVDSKAAERLARAHARYAAGVIHEVDGNSAEADEDYYEAALLDPDDETLMLEVSARLLRNKQPQKALELVTRAAQRPNASGEIYGRLGLIYAQLDEPDEALAANRQAIEKSPASLTGYQNLCQVYLGKKQPVEALQVLSEAAQQPDAEADFLIGAAELCAAVGLQAPTQRSDANAKALELLNRAARLGPGTPLSRLKLADGFNLLGESDQAAQFYLEVLKDPPDLPLVEERVRANLASIYLHGSDHQRASEQLQAILRDDPTNPQAYYYLGRMALEDKKPAEAADHFSKMLVLRPDQEPAYYYLALAQIELDKVGEALATLEKARQKFAQSFALEYYSGLAYSRKKAYAEASRHFLAAEVIAKVTDPGRLNEDFYFRLGAACERKGDYAQAEKYFERCLQLAPGFAEAQNYLGYMWAERGEKLERARELIEKAVKAEPRNAAFLDSMAWVLFKQGQPGEALPYALQAAELIEQPDATVYDHLGDIYAALKQIDKAREAWRKSLSIEPSEEVRKKIQAGGSK